MKITPEVIEKTFFDFVNKNRRAPSQEEMVASLGIAGEEVLQILGEYSKNLKTTWRLDEKERVMLGKLIIDTDESLHTLISNLSFLPVWSSQCRVINKKGTAKS